MRIGAWAETAVITAAALVSSLVLFGVFVALRGLSPLQVYLTLFQGAFGTRFSLDRAGPRYQERYWHDREFATVAALEPLAKEAGLSLTRLALAWVLANPVITAPIVGASRPEQLDDVLPAVETTLDPAIAARLDELTREYRWGDDIR